MPVARHLLVASQSLFAAAAGAAQTHYAWVGSIIDKASGNTRPADVRQLLEMTQTVS